MTTQPGRLRRLLAWVWRGQQMRELKQQRWEPSARQRFDEARSCQTLAWRVLGGLEPLPATTRDMVARPLLLAGILKCLPLVQLTGEGLDALFADPTWQTRLAQAGVGAELQPGLQLWLQDLPDEAKSGATAQHGLLTLNTLLDTLQLADRAIARLRWRRIGMLASASLFLASLITAVVLLVSPPEGPDLAAGKPWQASSFYPGYTASGLKPTNPTEGAFFCTGEDTSPWWSVDLKKSTSVGSVTVVNRGDCCIERAHPLVVELSNDGVTWHEVARRNESFRTWWPRFKATKTRYLRLRSLRRTYLHLKDVRVHPPSGR